MLEKKFVNIFGNKISYFEKGIGDTVFLFVSGFGTPLTVADMYQVFDKLSEKNRCIALDRFGYGYSDVINNNRSFDNISNEIIEFVKKLDIDINKVVFVGHSISTFYGIYLSSKVTLKGLVLIENEKITKCNACITKLVYGIYYSLRNTTLKKYFNNKAIKELFSSNNIPEELKKEGIDILKNKLPNMNMKDEIKWFVKEYEKLESIYTNEKVINTKMLLVCRDVTLDNNLELKNKFKYAKVLNLEKSGHYIHYYYAAKICENIINQFLL